MGKIKALEISTDQTTLTLKPVEPTDTLQLKPFWTQVARETTHTMRHPHEVFQNPAEMFETVRKVYQDPKTLWLGLFASETLVGFGSFHFPFKNHPWYQHLGTFELALLKSFWGMGLGRVLLETIESYAHKRGILKLEARVRADNFRALTLYEKLGYQIEGIRRSVAHIDCQYKDEVLIGKFL